METLEKIYLLHYANGDPFMELAKNHQFSDQSIREIIEETVKHTPSAFNNQTPALFCSQVKAAVSP